MRYFILIISIIFIFCSCKDKNSESSLTVYRAAEEGLRLSSKKISSSTDLIYSAFERMASDPGIMYIGPVWRNSAFVVKKVSDSIINYINGLKEELKNEAGGNDPKNINWENSTGVSEHLFESHGKGKELLEALIRYKESLLAIDSIARGQFTHRVNIFSNEFNFTTSDSVAFTKTFFSKIPVIAANVMLSKFINNVRIIENEIVIYYRNQFSH